MKALITGATSGIGKEMAMYLSSKGYDLVVVGRRKDALEDLQNSLNTKVEIEVMDLTNKENCIKLHDNHKDIDILINNAGFGLFGKFTDTNLDKEIDMINTNIAAVHILTKLYLKDMVEKDEGKILNVGSIAGFMPGPLMATYYSTKNYVVSLTRAINKELKKSKSKVKISVLCPGPTDTNFNKTASVRFKLKGMSSKYVARYGIDKMLKGKLIILPGFRYKVSKFLIKICPSSFAEAVTYNIQVSSNKEK